MAGTFQQASQDSARFLVIFHQQNSHTAQFGMSSPNASVEFPCCLVLCRGSVSAGQLIMLFASTLEGPRARKIPDRAATCESLARLSKKPFGYL
jgi:hypothetical protein